MPILIPDYLPYTPLGIECLRLGARRGGDGIGCCAMDVIQGFNNDPDKIRPQQPFYEGDSWSPLFYEGTDKQLCVGGEGITNEQAFLAYITHGSFTNEPAADHGFIAVLTDSQVQGETGKKWLRILKREGFKWVGAVSNSVYSEYHPNHVFMMLRSTLECMEADERERLKSPPEYWENLPEPTETPEERFYINSGEISKAHTPATEETAKAQLALRM